jgi:precorrin-6A/cobalt-precorrin-6A reductase
MRIIVMAGTSDAVQIIDHLSKHEDIEIIATTTTKYGGDLAVSAGADEIIVGRLGVHEIADLVVVNKIDLLVDATHPFASEASINAVKAAHNSGIKYIRYERPPIKIPNNENVFEVFSLHEAGMKALKLMKEKPDAKMMYLAGVTTLMQITKLIKPELIVARILPMVYSIKRCLEVGIPGENIIAMQGTFSKEFNKAMMKEYAPCVIITKESGESGGTPSKITAAVELKIPIILVKRPIISELKTMIVFNDMDKLLKMILSLSEN